MFSKPTTAPILAILTFVSLGLAPSLPAQEVSSHTLVFGVYQGEQTAGDVLASLRKMQHAAGEQIESSAVVSKSSDGKLTVYERPSAPSPAVELMLGTLGEPSRESATAADVINADVVDSLQASLTPGSSAVIALMDDRWVEDFQRALKATRARVVMAAAITQDEGGTR